MVAASLAATAAALAVWTARGTLAHYAQIDTTGLAEYIESVVQYPA